MRLSIIVPAYNVAGYLEKCIRSVYDQSLNEDEFEVIIVDDESSDNSLEVAKAIAETKSNIRVVTQRNRGLGGARNTGIKLAGGDYIAFLDSDDFFVGNSIDQVLQLAEKSDLDILEFGCQGLSVNGAIQYEKSESSQGLIYDGISYKLRHHYLESACNKLYKRSFLADNNLLFCERLYIEDFELNTRAFLRAKRVMACENIVGQFLQSPNSITRNNDALKKKKMREDIYSVIEKIANLDSRCDASERAYLRQRMSFLITTLFYKCLMHGSSVQEVCQLKQQLIDANIYFVSTPIYDRRKNLFRIVCLKNFNFFKSVLLLNRIKQKWLYWKQ